MKEKGDYSKGSIAGNVLRLAGPMILAELVNVLYNIVDRIFIGHIPGAGTQALTGVGLAMPLISLVSAFGMLICLGGGPICSIARGQKDDGKAAAVLETSFTLTLLFSAVLTLVLYVMRVPLLYLIGADDLTIGFAEPYFGIYALGTVFVLITLGMNTFIHLQGYSRTGMLTVVIGAVVNTVLDPLFIFTFGMGIRGAAVATVIAQFLSALWVCLFLTRGKAPLKIRRLRLEMPLVKEILKLGVTGFIFRVTNSITQSAVNMVLHAAAGAEALLYIGTVSVINSVRQILMMITDGLVNAAVPVMGYNYGAKLYDRVSRTIGFATIASLCYNVVCWGFLMLFPDFFIRLFSDDAELLRTAVPCFKVYFSAYFMMTWQMVGQQTFIGLNRPGFAVFFSMFRKVMLILPLTILLPRTGLGVMGVFEAERISEIVGGIACFTTMYLCVWRKIRQQAKEQSGSDLRCRRDG